MPNFQTINVRDLRIGMFIEELCGPWMSHPFWRSQFVVTERELRMILASRVLEVVIDLDKTVLPEEPLAKLESRGAIEVPTSKIRPPAHCDPTPLAEELEHAARICSQAKTAVQSMLNEVRMGKAVSIESVNTLVEDISSSVIRNSGALISLARLKTADDYTYLHSVAVCALMVALARQLGLTEQQVRQAGVAGLLHDIGKALVPTEILNKPGKLTDEEFEIVKTHSVKGHEVLSQWHGLEPAALDVCLHHHEKIDGSGYPNGLTHDQISLFARMGAVCDVYDAITSNRPYKAGWEPAESLRRMAEWNQHFDQRIFHAFVKSLGIYPIGTLVKLRSGLLAVVVEQSRASLLKPQVKTFFSTATKSRILPEIIDLSRPTAGDAIVSIETPASWGFADLSKLWGNIH
jgi:putative nucleotidyltransferase with HDIG domain